MHISISFAVRRRGKDVKIKNDVFQPLPGFEVKRSHLPALVFSMEPLEIIFYSNWEKLEQNCAEKSISLRPQHCLEVRGG